VFFCSPQNFSGDTFCGTNSSYWFRIVMSINPTCDPNFPLPPSVNCNTSTVAPGGTALITGTVTPGTNPTSTGLAVTGDLSSLGGPAAQAFFDDGTHGDVTAGDNIFSFAFTVSASQGDGSSPVPLVVTDAQGRSGTCTASVVVDVGELPGTAAPVDGPGAIS